MALVVTKICPICQKDFVVRACVADVRRCCSVRCQGLWKRTKRVERVCKTCEKTFEARPSDFNKGSVEYCSRECLRPMYAELFRGNKYREGKKPWNKGLVGVATGKKGPRPHMRGAKNLNWKGANATYSSVHAWVRRYLGRPDTCTHCRTSGLDGRKIHWANISQKYYRNLDDWVRLCAKCHGAYDSGKLTMARTGG